MNSNGSPTIKILCIDDEDDLLAIFRNALEKTGFEILTAKDGQSALQLVKDHSGYIAGIVSDYSMPGMNGFELRRALLKDYKDIPFILVSGYITREQALSGVELKIGAFLEKPFETKSFLDLVLRESKDRVSSIRDDSEMLVGFTSEAESLLEEMEALLIGLEENAGDIDAINRIFACAHTIKGTSAFFKPDTVHKFTHRYEDYFAQFKKGEAALSPSAISVLLKGLDTIKMLIANLAGGSKETYDLEALTAIFAKQSTSIAPIGETGPQVIKKEVKPQPKSENAELRVSTALLNNFMEKSGELTVLRNMLNKVVRAIESTNPTDQNIIALTDLLGEMHKVNGFMQDQVVDLRKIPLKQVYKPLTRNFRDLCVNLKKQINFELSNDDLRVDHTIAEILNKCLIHLLRNAADHGIESTETRTTAKKPAKGSIRISAIETDDEILVKLQDDGRGIDPEKIRAKAIEKNILTAETASSLTPKELQMLIFEAGFSTAEQVTGVSGRGVGTDMVKSTVLAAGGSVEIDSTVGKGTTFTLRLPIPKSVLIFTSLLVRCQNITLAIPQDRVIKAVHVEVESCKLQKVGSAYFLVEDEDLVPILNLNSILKIPSLANQNALALICVQSETGLYYLQVDEILDIEDTVVKQVSPWLKDIPAYSGATFLGDGRIGLILDTDGIGQISKLPVQKKRSKNEVALSTVETPKEPGESILLFQLDEKCLYGVMQSEIFRLEEFSPDQIQYSGKQPVVVYRGQSMPLFSLKKEIAVEKSLKQSEKLTHEPLIVVVVTESEKFYGFAVNSIQDLVKTPHRIENTMKTPDSETCIVQDRTVTLLKLRSLASEKIA